MLKRTFLSLLVLVLLALPVAAQDDDSDEEACTIDLTTAIATLQSAQDDLDTTGDTDAALLTLEDVEAQLAEIRAGCATWLELTETYTPVDAMVPYEVSYPEGWIVDEDFGVVLIGSSQAAIEAFDSSDIPSIAEDDYALALFIDINNLLPPIAETVTVDIVIEELVNTIGIDGNDDLDFELSEQENFSVNDQRAARVDITFEVGTVIPIIAVDYGAGQVMAWIGITTMDSLDTFNEVAIPIIESFSFLESSPE
jgi:hypothetical protein